MHINWHFKCDFFIYLCTAYISFCQKRQYRIVKYQENSIFYILRAKGPDSFDIKQQIKSHHKYRFNNLEYYCTVFCNLDNREHPKKTLL